MAKTFSSINASTAPVTRLVLALVLGNCVAAVVWYLLGSIHPRFWLTGPTVIALAMVAGIAGGFVAALQVPQRKVLTSLVVGTFLALTLLALYPIFHFRLGSRNPLLWYWPIWFIPGFVCGGLLSKLYLFEDSKSR